MARGVINCSVLELIPPYFRPDFTLVSACGLRAKEREREKENLVASCWSPGAQESVSYHLCKKGKETESTHKGVLFGL